MPQWHAREHSALPCMGRPRRERRSSHPAHSHRLTPPGRPPVAMARRYPVGLAPPVLPVPPFPGTSSAPPPAWNTLTAVPAARGEGRGPGHALAGRAGTDIRRPGPSDAAARAGAAAPGAAGQAVTGGGGACYASPGCCGRGCRRWKIRACGVNGTSVSNGEYFLVSAGPRSSESRFAWPRRGRRR